MGLLGSLMSIEKVDQEFFNIFRDSITYEQLDILEKEFEKEFNRSRNYEHFCQLCIINLVTQYKQYISDKTINGNSESEVRKVIEDFVLLPFEQYLGLYLSQADKSKGDKLFYTLFSVKDRNTASLAVAINGFAAMNNLISKYKNETFREKQDSYLTAEIIRVFQNITRNDAPKNAKEIERMSIINNDKAVLDGDGYSFNNAIEYVLYLSKMIQTGKKDEIKPWINNTLYQSTYKKAIETYAKGGPNKEITVLNECLKINPVGVAARLELSQMYVNIRHLDRAKEELKTVSQYLYNKSNIAYYYRQHGFIAFEKKDWILADACYTYSQCFEKSNKAEHELMLIFLTMQSMGIKMPTNIETILDLNSITVFDPEMIEVSNETIANEIKDIDVKNSDDLILQLYNQIRNIKPSKTAVKSENNIDSSCRVSVAKDSEETDKAPQSEERGKIEKEVILKDQEIESATNDKVWINPQTNKIECRGDNCPQKNCDETCPIWLSTLASRAYASKDYNKTIEYLNKAVSIEPDFKDAWNNMGACYGFIGKYKESLDAYLKAVEIDPNYRNPYYGIVLNYKNMEDYQTAIEWCKKYRDRFHNDFLDEQYKECKQLLALQKETNVEEKGGLVEESIGTRGIIDQKQFEDAYGRIAAVLANEATFDKGYDELEKLANEGCLEAIVLVGQLSHGNDDELAMKCFQKAADAGMSEGYWGLSGYIRHNFVPDLSNPDDLKWVNCVKKAAELGCHDAMNELGNIYNRLGQFQHCMYWYLMADHNEHEQGKIGAKGVSQKWKASGYPMDTFKDLSEAKIEDATIIMRYYAGDCDAKTMVKSLEEVALKDGHTLAAVWIGKVYENKEMLGMSYRFYNIAAMEGDANANRILGDLYMSGRGVRQSVQEAYNHYLEAAEAGQRHACFVIGEFERNAGRKEKANAWYMKAYVRGYTEAIHRVIKLQS